MSEHVSCGQPRPTRVAGPAGQPCAAVESGAADRTAPAPGSREQELSLPERTSHAFSCSIWKVDPLRAIAANARPHVHRDERQLVKLCAAVRCRSADTHASRKLQRTRAVRLRKKLTRGRYGAAASACVAAPSALHDAAASEQLRCRRSSLASSWRIQLLLRSQLARVHHASRSRGRSQRLGAVGGHRGGVKARMRLVLDES